MKSIYSALLVFFVLCSGFAYAQRSDRMVKGQDRILDDNTNYNLIPVNQEPIRPPFVMEFAPSFSNGDVIIGPEISTTNTGFGDYKTNGESNHYLQVDPSNPLLIHAVDVQADSTDPTGVTTRRTKYAFSSNGGLVWTVSTDVPTVRSGFAVLELLTTGSGNVAAIANHSGAPNTYLYVDAFPQLGSFTEYVTPSPISIWPQITTLSNGNIIVISRPQSGTSAQNDTLFYSIWNGTTFSPKQVAYIATPPYAGGVAFSNMAYNVADNNNGTVGIVANAVTEDEVLGSQVIKMRISTDNGASFGSTFDIFTPFLENSGQDTVAMAGGSDLVFKPNTNEWYWACSGNADGLFAKTRIFLIKGTGSTVGSTTVIADTVNIPDLARTFAKPWAFQSSIDHPKLGWSADNNVLYCSFDVVTADTGMNGFNTRDVFYMFSTNSGTNWSNPIRVTNTPTIDEGFPTISLWNGGTNAATYDLNLLYMKDPGDGPTTFNGTNATAPASRNTQIYRKITLATTGIHNNEITNLSDYKLLQNFPNPFNPATTISYNLPKNENVTLKVFNSAGKEVATLVNSKQTAGTKSVSFDASSLSSGIYFYTLSAGEFRETKKMILLK